MPAGDSGVQVRDDTGFMVHLTAGAMAGHTREPDYHGSGVILVHALFSPGYEATLKNPAFLVYNPAACRSREGLADTVVDKTVSRLPGTARDSSVSYAVSCLVREDEGARTVTVATVGRADQKAFETYVEQASRPAGG